MICFWAQDYIAASVYIQYLFSEGCHTISPKILQQLMVEALALSGARNPLIAGDRKKVDFETLSVATK